MPAYKYLSPNIVKGNNRFNNCLEKLKVTKPQSILSTTQLTAISPIEGLSPRLSSSNDNEVIRDFKFKFLS